MFVVCRDNTYRVDGRDDTWIEWERFFNKQFSRQRSANSEIKYNCVYRTVQIVGVLLNISSNCSPHSAYKVCLVNLHESKGEWNNTNGVCVYVCNCVCI